MNNAFVLKRFTLARLNEHLEGAKLVERCLGLNNAGLAHFW